MVLQFESVPNCDNTDLVMWAFCTSGRIEDSNWNYHDFDFIRFVVMRGLNLAEESHGIMGETPYYNWYTLSAIK